MRRHHIWICAILAVCFGLGFVIAGAQTPLPQEPKSFTFVVFGDNRPDKPNLAQPGVFKTILKAIDEVNPAFAVNTGDCIYGSYDLSRVKEQYEEYASLTRTLLRARTYLALGNHEVLDSKANHDFFAKELGGLYYSFDHADCHFIVLDSEVVGETGRISGEQLKWLKEDLHKARAARYKFVFLHRPLYPVDGHMGKCLDQFPKDRDALHSLFVRNRISAVFMGHEHLFYEQVKNGVRYVITGGGGAGLYPSIHGEGDFHHFVAVSVGEDKIEMKVIKPSLNGRPAEEIRVK
jgi:3',5'-cyclic AMP phosphodiesterase CpdA